MNNNNKPQIPNIVFFINFGARPLTLLHSVAILAASKRQHPDQLILYCDHDPETIPDQKYWSALRALVTVRIVEAPTHCNGIELQFVQYKADVFRLEKLIEHGGIYMDLDLLQIRDMSELLCQHQCILSTEHSSEGLDGTDAKQLILSNAVLASTPSHPFIVKWLAEVPHHLHKTWAFAATILPKELLQEDPDLASLVHVETMRRLTPMHYLQPFVFYREPTDEERDIASKAYALHYFETWTMHVNSPDEYKKFNDLAYVCSEPYIRNTIFYHHFAEFVNFIATI